MTPSDFRARRDTLDKGDPENLLHRVDIAVEAGEELFVVQVAPRLEDHRKEDELAVALLSLCVAVGLLDSFKSPLGVVKVLDGALPILKRLRKGEVSHRQKDS